MKDLKTQILEGAAKEQLAAAAWVWLMVVRMHPLVAQEWPEPWMGTVLLGHHKIQSVPCQKCARKLLFPIVSDVTTEWRKGTRNNN